MLVLVVDVVNIPEADPALQKFNAVGRHLPVDRTDLSVGTIGRKLWSLRSRSEHRYPVLGLSH